MIDLAMRGGHLNCVKFLREEKGIELSDMAINYAAGVGSLECMKYALESGCIWNERTCKYAAKGNFFLSK